MDPHPLSQFRPNRQQENLLRNVGKRPVSAIGRRNVHVNDADPTGNDQHEIFADVAPDAKIVKEVVVYPGDEHHPAPLQIHVMFHHFQGEVQSDPHLSV